MNIRRNILLRPLDSVHWGPPQANQAGDTHYARCEFPPTPRTIQGLLRTRLLQGADPKVALGSGADQATIATLVGPPDSLPDGWSVTGPFPVGWEPTTREDKRYPEPYFPVPAFVAIEPTDEKNKGRCVGRARKIRSEHRSWDSLGTGGESPDALYGFPRGDKNKAGGLWWVRGSDLAQLMLNTISFGFTTREVTAWRALPPFVRGEQQTGIEVDEEKGTAKDEMLYTLQRLRFEQGTGLWCSFVGDVKAPLQPGALTTGAGSMGRKSGAVALEEAKPWPQGIADYLNGSWIEPWVTEQGKTGDPLRLWMVLVTPGKLSEKTDSPVDLAVTNHGGARVRVHHEGMLCGPRWIGGFDWAKKAPRENRCFADLGTAFPVEVFGGSSADRVLLIQQLHHHTVVGQKADTQMGFGHVLLGPMDDDKLDNTKNNNKVR